LALNAHLWREARSKIELIIEKRVTVSYCLLMSELERLEMHDDDLSKSWLEKASRALPDKTWACNRCGAVALEWSATCGNCNAFDTIIWKEPPRVEQLHTVLVSEDENQQAPIIENEKLE
jgi:HemY protein